MKSSPASSFDFNVVTETSNIDLPHQPAVRIAGYPVLELIYRKKDSFRHVDSVVEGDARVCGKGDVLAALLDGAGRREAHS